MSSFAPYLMIYSSQTLTHWIALVLSLALIMVFQQATPLVDCL